MTYDKGDRVRIEATFTDLAGVLADPTTVSVHVRSPSRVVTIYTYAAAQVVKDSVGNYHFDFDVTAAGTWTHKWFGTGNLVAAQEGALFVQRGAF